MCSNWRWVRMVRDWWMIRNRKEEEERPRRIISHLNQIYKTFIMQQQIIQQQFGSQLTQQHFHNFTKRPLNERKKFFKLNFEWNNRIFPFWTSKMIWLKIHEYSEMHLTLNDLNWNNWALKIYRLKRTGGVW